MKYVSGIIRAFDRAKALETRTIPFVISSSDRDRHGSVVNMKGWELENYNLNPIVGYQHDVYGGNFCRQSDPDNVIGTGKVYIEDDLLIGEPTFENKEVNPLAEKIFQKVLAGTLRATSVGFMEVGEGETKRVTDAAGNLEETYYFQGQELLEFSIVNIPSNAKAVRRSIPNHMDSALAYLMTLMPETVSLKEMKKMSVQQVLDIVSNQVQQDVAKDLQITGKSKGIFERKLRMIESQINNH